MDISSITVNSGVINDVPARVATPAKTTEHSLPAQKADGNAGITPAEVKQIVSEMQKQVEGMNIGLEYSFYGKHDSEIAVRVVNKETGEVIREIPAKEMQSLQAQIGELVGSIFNVKA